MSNLHSGAEWPQHFSGVVNLFPLPNLVLFPHIVQPLQIFEPRYCELLLDSLAGDCLVAMALLDPGWEQSYSERPAIAPIVCIGKVISHSPTEDRRHNILLAGMRRARIVRELDNDRVFRQAEVEVLEDHYPEGEAGLRNELYNLLIESFTDFVPESLTAMESFKQLIGQQLPLGMLTDIITHMLGLPLTVKQQVLAEPNVDVRCRLLTRCLQQMRQARETTGGADSGAGFPPKFSQN